MDFVCLLPARTDHLLSPSLFFSSVYTPTHAGVQTLFDYLEYMQQLQLVSLSVCRAVTQDISLRPFGAFPLQAVSVRLSGRLGTSACL